MRTAEINKHFSLRITVSGRWRCTLLFRCWILRCTATLSLGSVYSCITVVLQLYYVLNVIIPTILLNILSLLVFHLPVESGEKLSLGVTVMLAYTVVLLIILDLTPASGQNLPIVCEYDFLVYYCWGGGRA